jgi:cobalt/nickel transport system permease protein
VLILQCFLFADGGVTALGANILNMGILAPNLGYVIYRLMQRLSGSTLRGRLFATAFAAWCSTVAAAILCAGELTVSNTIGWQVAFPAMTTIHLLIGIGEAVITTLVVFALAKSRPEVLADSVPTEIQPRMRGLLVYGLLIAAALAIFVAPFACSWPDGLDHVATVLGFANNATSQPLITSPLPDYSIPGLDSAVASTAIAGAIGLVIAFLLSYLLARRLTPHKATD